MRSLSIYKHTVLGEIWSHSNSKHVRCHFLPCQQKEQVPETICWWGGAGEAPWPHRNSSIHLESTCWGLAWGAAGSDWLCVLVQLLIGNWAMTPRICTPWSSCCRAPRGGPSHPPDAAGATGTHKDFVLLRCEPEPKHKRKYWALVWDFRSFSSWQVSFPNQVSAWVRVLWLFFFFFFFILKVSDYAVSPCTG